MKSHKADFYDDREKTPYCSRQITKRQISNMKKYLIALFCLAMTISFAQHQKKVRLINMDKNELLDSIFPIDNIVSIKVTNNNGTHILTEKELTTLKGLLKRAKFAGGLLAKPGHITLDIKLEDNTTVKSGFVYASTGAIHFDNAIDKFKQNFSGSFYLPKNLNFDNYK